MAAGRFNLKVLQRDNDAKRRIIEAINYEDSESIYSSSRGFKSAQDSIAQPIHQFESRHEDAIFKNGSSVHTDITERSDEGGSSMNIPLYKTLKVGDRILATIDLPRHLQEGGVGAARRIRGTVFATVKAVIHSGFSSARYDILLDGPDGSSSHCLGHGSISQEIGRKRLQRDNPNLLTVGWASLQAVSCEPPPSSSMPLNAPSPAGLPSTGMVAPHPPLPPPPPPLRPPPPPSTLRSDDRPASVLVEAAVIAPAIAVPLAAPPSEATAPSSGPSSVPSAAALLNPSLYAGRVKGGWKAAVRKL